jgi:hypothetical protein
VHKAASSARFGPCFPAGRDFYLLDGFAADLSTSLIVDPAFLVVQLPGLRPQESTTCPAAGLRIARFSANPRNCHVSAGLCQPKSTGEGTNSDQ